MWDRRSPEQVQAVADALDVPDRDVQLESVPDIWAVPLKFESALLADPRTKRTAAAEAEWRGLLAILALREWRFIQGIDFIPVFKPEPATKFLKVAKQLLPDHLRRSNEWEKTSIEERTTWHDISLITMNHQVVGLTSPTTLVCPGAGPGPKDLSHVNWFNQSTGRFRDPKPHLSPAETKALASWIAQVQDYLANVNCSGIKYIRLSKLLTAFRQSLVPGIPNKNEHGLAATSNVEGIALHVLGRPIAHREDDTISDVELATFRGTRPERALVLSEDMPKQWKKSATEINVVSSTPLQAALIGLDRDHGDQIHGRPIDKGQWYLAEDFFTTKLYAFTVDAGLQGAIPVRGQTLVRIFNASGEPKPSSLIIPIQKRWLDWLTASEVAKRVEFAPQGEEIEVSLRLPLSGGDFVIKHRYQRKSIVDLGNEPPVTKIWPFLNSADWRAYYTYYDNFREDKIYFQPYVPGAQATSKAIPVANTTSVHRSEVTKTTTYPEAMTATLGGVEAGVILLQQPLPPVASGQEWKVGIDFGTTGTTVFAASSQTGDGSALLLQNRLQSITKESSSFANLTYRRFMPFGPEDGGALLSIYHDFNVAKPDRPNYIQPLTEGHICFISDAASFSASEPGISTNMKWGNERDRARAKAFLQQLAMQIAAEAAASGARAISWRFSFPTAFSERELNTFGNIWEEIVRRCEQDAGINAIKHNDALYKRKNESHAAAHAFRKNERAAPQQGAVFVDIGGGTTDIAIWQGNKQLSQSSFRFAGRDVFLHLIYLRPTILKIFGDTSKLDELRKGDEYIFHSQVDVILRGQKGKELLDQLSVLVNDENPLIEQFLQLLNLGIAGILHFIGLVVRDLEARGKYKRFMPSIYIGGNGSKILHWLGHGKFKPRSPAETALKTVFARATGFTDLGKAPFEILTSGSPKCEVAEGLILDLDPRSPDPREPVDLFEDQETDPPLLAGEDYLLDGATQGWNTFFNPDSDLSGIQVVPGLPQIQALLKALKMELDEYVVHRCVGDINQRLADTANVERRERHLEPLFITALRALHTQQANTWAKSELSQKEK